MAKDGWIERRAAANDRRIKTIHLLPKASGTIKKIDAVIFAMRKEALHGFSKAELSACANTLRKLRDRTVAGAPHGVRNQERALARSKGSSARQ